MPRRSTIEYNSKKDSFRCQVGTRIRRIDNDIKKEKNAVKVETTDGDNRRYIVRLIVNNIKSGKTEEEALDIAINDELAKSFNYLEKNGLDKRECFRNWFSGYLKTENKKTNGVKER